MADDSVIDVALNFQLISEGKDFSNNVKKAIDAGIDRVDEAKLSSPLKRAFTDASSNFASKMLDSLKEIAGKSKELSAKQLKEEFKKEKEKLDLHEKDRQNDLKVARQVGKIQAQSRKAALQGGLGNFQSALNLRNPMAIPQMAQKMFQRGGARRQATGGALEQQARATKDVGTGEALKGVASSMKTLGTSMSFIAGTLGAVVALVKAFIDLDAKIKEINKDIVQTAATSDFGFSAAEASAGAYSDELTKMRDDLSGLNDSFNNFNASTKEQISVLTSLNKSGVTFKEMRQEFAKGVDGFKDYDDAVGSVLTYARALGQNSQAMAKQIGDLKYMTSSSLPQITEQFSVITKEAERAGFVTNRFYSAVLQATSGMAYYGVRIEETTKVLATMGTLIGQVYGEQLMKGLGAKFTTSYKENLKHIMTHGSDRVAKTMSMSYEMRLKQYARDFEELGKTQEERQKKLTDIMNSSDQSEATRKAIAAGVTDGKVLGDIQQLLALKKGGEGNMAAQMTGMSAMGAGGKLLNMMYSSNLFSRGTDAEVMDQAFRTGDPVLVAALEEVEKISGVQGEQVMSLTRNAQQAFRLAKQTAKEGGTTEDLSGLAQKLGLEINKEGQIVKDGVEIKGWEQLFMASVDSSDKLKDMMKSEAEKAADLAQTTKSINDVLSQSILGILIDIYALIEPAINWFMKNKGIRNYEERRDRSREGAKKRYEYRDKVRDKEDKELAFKIKTLEAEGKNKEANQLKKAQSVRAAQRAVSDEQALYRDQYTDAGEHERARLRQKAAEKLGVKDLAGMAKALTARKGKTRGGGLLTGSGNAYDMMGSKEFQEGVGSQEGDLMQGLTHGFKQAGGSGFGMLDMSAGRNLLNQLYTSEKGDELEKLFGGKAALGELIGGLAHDTDGDTDKMAELLAEAVQEAIVEKTQQAQLLQIGQEAAGQKSIGAIEMTINQLGGDDTETIRILRQFLDNERRSR